LKKKTVVVTGVCGLIGSHLADELLSMGHRVIGVDDLSFGKTANVRQHAKNPRFELRRFDILDTAKLTRAVKGADAVVHLAAVKKIAEKDPALPTLTVNAEGTRSVLEAARARKTKVVVGSTSDVYGGSTALPFREDGECVSGSPDAKRWAYAVSKLFSEHLALSYYKDYGVPVVVLRYFGCFSERSSSTWSGGHVPIFIESIAAGKPVTVHGDGSQTRSMAHVSDVVRGTLLALENPTAVGEIVNVGNDEEVSVLDCAKMIHRLLGVKGRLKVERVPMKQVFGSYREIARRVPDLSKAKTLLGYEPLVPFEEALRRVIAARRA